MDVSIDEIKRLKELSGAGLSDAKAALIESKGDFDSALKAMRKKGLTKAEKRSEREARAGLIGTYNHDGRIGVLVEVNCETDFVARNELFKDLLKDICMHIAAMNPLYLNQDSISKADLDRLKKEFSEDEKINSKPEAVKSSIVKGQVDKYISEHCLDEQPFVKNPDITVRELVIDASAKLGEKIVVRRFSRFELGETKV